MSEVTRGRVDNENNSQSRYSNIPNMVQGGVYIYKSESIAIRNRSISEYRLGTQEGSVYRKGNTGMLCQNNGQEQEQEIRTGTGTGTNLRW